MPDFSNYWYVYMVIVANLAFMLVLMFVSLSEAIRRD